ncbi:MAG TPA: SRPBCC domain-containing protein [Polyangiaceae bacterium]|nr:SRPBCC domain-containing protein [Polyangiaceae bacterium]
MFELTSATEISAPAETVWRILTDFDGYADWNPFIVRASGSARIGGEVHLRVRSSMGVHLRFHATVTDHQQNHELRWRGQLLSRAVAAGEHVFSIEPTGTARVRFVQHEIFRGALPLLFESLLERETRRGFDAMNHALRARAEREATATPRESRAWS